MVLTPEASSEGSEESVHQLFHAKALAARAYKVGTHMKAQTKQYTSRSTRYGYNECLKLTAHLRLVPISHEQTEDNSEYLDETPHTNKAAFH